MQHLHSDLTLKDIYYSMLTARFNELLFFTHWLKFAAAIAGMCCGIKDFLLDQVQVSICVQRELKWPFVSWL